MTPAQTNALIARAVALHESGELAAAQKLYSQILQLEPRNFNALHHSGIVATQLGRPDLGRAMIKRALGERRTASALSNLGASESALGNLAAARSAYEQALELDEKQFHAHNGLGGVLLRMKEVEAADRSFRRASKLEPDNPLVVVNLASIAMQRGLLDHAEQLLERAVELDPGSAGAWANKGKLYKERLDPERALESYDRALALEPGLAQAEYNLATLLLSLGQYREGWIRHEQRWLTPDFPSPLRRLKAPQWAGEPLQEATLLIHGEQGLGDIVQFGRFVGRVIEEHPAAQILIEVEHRLVPLFAERFETAKVLAYADAAGGNLPHYDLHVPMASLPLCLGIDRPDALGPVDYLQTSSGMAAERANLRIGISWRSVNKASGAARSIELGDFAGIAAIPGIQLVDLQYGDTRQEREVFAAAGGYEIEHDDSVDALKELAGFKRLLESCDLVVSVDNSTVHLAAAFGVPVWMLLPLRGDWRWGLTGEFTPWYPEMRIYRQEEEGDWSYPLSRAERDLIRWRREGRALSRPVAAPPSLIKPSALLVNDTSYWYHWGCFGTSSALTDALRERGYWVRRLAINQVYRAQATLQSAEAMGTVEFIDGYRRANRSAAAQIEAADLVLVNGEGTLHGWSPGCQRLLEAIGFAASVRGERATVVNAGVFPPTAAEAVAVREVYRRALSGLGGVAVRDAASQAALAELGITAKLAFDSLPLALEKRWATLDLRRGDRVVIAGSSRLGSAMLDGLAGLLKHCLDKGIEVLALGGAAAFPASDERQFVDELRKRQPDGWRVVKAASFDEWLAVLGGARVLVTGRFHYSIAAHCLGVPVVAFAGNTRKVHMLAEELGIEAPMDDTREDFQPALLERFRAAYAAGAVTEDEALTECRRLGALARGNFEQLPDFAEAIEPG